ncbi:hypothetical protein ACHAXR_001521 [Thalassiosira sp. AJA248-18]
MPESEDPNKALDPNDDLFETSGAGSPRYMAPELLRGEEYNLKADVYSFAIILWEMLAGQQPYAFVRNRNQLVHHVVQEQGRPGVDSRWPAKIKNVLESSFGDKIEIRPVCQIQIFRGFVKPLSSSLNILFFFN